MIKKWLEPILNHHISLQERMFRLLTVIGIVTLFLMLVYGSITGENHVNLLLLTVCIAYAVIVICICIRTHRINTGATLISLLLLIFFPLNFFTAGGMYGSSPIWFVFCFVYISLTISGKRKFFFWLAFALLVMLCYYLGFYYPRLVMPHTLKFANRTSEFSVIAVGLIISITVLLQNRVYEEENKLASRQKKEIEELNQAENRFFSSMSHEIRTPINTIIGLNEMILRSDISDEVADNARNIGGASKMLLTLINDILDLSKIESGKMEIVAVSYETGALFSDIINMIWIKAKEKHLEFHLNIDSSLPSMLCGDEIRIKQILINLLNNAVKYTKEGSVTLSVRCDRLSLNKVRVYYSVSDTGMGIKRESIEHLFDAFQRVDIEQNRWIEGTGLGLSIVKQLVELMGGEISVNSVYTQGSTFLVTLDQEIVSEKALGTFTLESRTKNGERTQYKQSFEAPEARLLIVDDNEMNLLVASRLLSATKLRIDTARSGAECLRLTQTQHYDGILMDHLMPEMDGIECLHALRSQTGGLCHDTPVIALTANAGSDSQLLYSREGFDGYLAKPVSGMLLEAAILNILPEELIRSRAEETESQTQLGKEGLLFDKSQRLPLAITTDSVCDLPKELTEKLGITVLPYYVCTDKGRFLDESEIQTDDLLAWLMSGQKGHSQSPDVSDYERFFARRLTEAQNVIHITMAKKSSEGYKNASEAAKSFDNVTILNSGHLSSSMGISVLYAAQMAKNNASKEEITEMVRQLKHRISSAFIINDTHMLYHAGKIPKSIHMLCEALLIHPVIILHKSKITVGGIHFGNTEQVTRSYIRRVLKNPADIDTRLLFITYAGMDESSLREIREMVEEYCKFDTIYFQKASSAISSNCGPGSFGLLFMRKGA